MCACEPGFTCAACRDTPADDRYLDDDPMRQVDEAIDELVEYLGEQIVQALRA